MKLTCLSKGNGFYFPPCHVLTFAGFRILLDFPIDLSALAAFSPRPVPIRRAQAGDDASDDVRSEVYKRRRSEKGLEAGDLLKAVPWYKMVENLEALDVSSIDVVLITSAVGVLGLPFLTKRKYFCAKVYATEPAARIGKLMMLELVSMNMEFRQFYGRDESEFPNWLKREELELVHPTLRRILGSYSSADMCAWQPLYSAADVNDCMKKIQMLKYCEEVCYNGILVLKPCSSGLDIGACNWVVRSPRRNMAYVGCSIVGSSIAARFDYQSLQGNELIFFSDSSCSLDTCNSSMKSSVTSSSATSQTMREKSTTKEDISQNDCHDVSEESDKISFICSMVLRSIVEGGSVLIPTGRLGIMLQLLELITKNLDSANLKCPIFIISTVGEEILSYVSVIPEWLSRSRQEKLYSGEPFFHHVDLIKEKKIQLFPAIYSSKLINAWQEPCIVLCSHWSLRLGPVVNLLQRWCEDSRSLLIFEEGIDAKLALLPFGQVKMRVLQCSFLSGLKGHTIEPVMQMLRPKLLLVPEELRPTLDGKLKDLSTLFFSEKKTQRVPSLRENYEANLTTDLAFQLKPRRMRQETIAVARLRGRVTVTNGKYVLEPLNGAHSDSSRQKVLFWGSYDAKQFLQALEEIGIKGHVENTSSIGDPCVIHINGYDGAFVEIGKTQTVIAAGDEDLASRLLEAVRSVLDCI